jgi:formate dehydrogenase iron-sulfur subunit
MSTAIESKKALGDTNATLVDTTRCVGCRSCQVSCKQWNDLEAERTAIDGKKGGLQQPTTVSAKTLTVVTFNEVEDAAAPGGLRYVMAKRQCMHCDDPACASACPVTAMTKTAEGPVVYDEGKCIGCRYCMWACPFGVPTAEWDSLAPKISKCTMCADRGVQGAATERNGVALTPEEQERFARIRSKPACVQACPTNALVHGKRDDLLAEARARIAASPGRYVNEVYGEKEAGGTNVLYLASTPFATIGFPAVGTESYPGRSVAALSAVPPAVIGVGAALGGIYALQKRKAEVAKQEAPAKHDPHVAFAPLKKPFATRWNLFLAALMAWGGLSFIARFALGLGGSTNLSDTYAWGLWIVFDLVWIAVAAGAFATAGLIYVFHRKDLYPIGRAAVLMGLLSYSFVTVTLLADLGLPWHFYQLGLQAPKHSAMFEVSWCVGLYVTVLAFEFLPVPFERWKLAGALEAWKRWSPVYVVLAITGFVYLMSRSLAYAAVACAVFSALAYAFRQKAGEKPVPILLAIAAVTLSTMHQSSLGSLFLLMPDKLDARWWSPIMPVAFFLSSIAAGTALMVLVEMWIAKGYERAVRVHLLAAIGKIAFWSLLVYEVVRLGDVVARGRLGAALAGPKGLLFAAEILLGGVLPLALLATARLREKPAVVLTGAALAAGGVVFNRMNVVVFAMDLRGPAPQIAPAAYFPSVVEWGISVGLIAATVFLFGLAVRLMPVLSSEDVGHAGHGGDDAQRSAA